MSRRIGTVFYALLVTCGQAVAGSADIDFESQIAPIFEQHCLKCHSDNNRKGDISLSSVVDLLASDHLSAGEPNDSYLLELIAGADGEPPEMPKNAPPLTKTQVEIIRQWIAQGAKWPEGLVLRERSRADASWWSLQPLAEIDANENAPATIDRFVKSKLNAKGLAMNPPAGRRELIRRATYDLTGLPPTPEDVAKFVADDSPAAYEQLIDRLLASPHYGERWGRHWLDVVRFGESNGFERNVVINELWPFRDYVIESINADKPFNQFIREHIAGDVFGKDQPEIEIGSAFLVAGPYDNVGNQDAIQAAQIRADTIDEMIRATSEAFLGLTIGCARCHDHKFDPIRQSDYYSLYATFSGVRHGARDLGTAETRSIRAKKLQPLQQRKAKLEKQKAAIDAAIMARAKKKLTEYERQWNRPRTSRTGTEDRFEPVTAKFVRLLCDAQDSNPRSKAFRIDEFEIWSAGDKPTNVALASNGGKATGASRKIEDFPGAYGPQLTIDGEFGSRFISAGPGGLIIELARPTQINRVLFSSARGEPNPGLPKFAFVADYRIEVSLDGKTWNEIASGQDRKPVSAVHRDVRLRTKEITPGDRKQLTNINRDLQQVNRELAALPKLQRVWVGTRNANDAKGPFHIFLGGSPERKGKPISLTSLHAFSNPQREDTRPYYDLNNKTPEADRRVAFADWTVDSNNPLTLRVLANRVWHYHFGTGLVDTPSDFGYMGGRPSHPQLLDWLAGQLRDGGWKLKPLHRLIMLSDTYRQSSAYRNDAGNIDSDARLLWRFSPRRLSAEEIRDTVLTVAGKLDKRRGGPGFRLYRYLQDNVATYVPLDDHDPTTYRRAVYHQNARASVVDLMTDFDQPDCAFSTPSRSQTTTPLQALTMLNHNFTLDMAKFLSERLEREAPADVASQVNRAYQLCYHRNPTTNEATACRNLAKQHGLAALCRVLFNTGELIYVK